ncbi:MAG: hypothetical protein CMP91_08410 [Gammaproteobacteria bacterium]|nr:hypothetical protein [Gammaproteobacteria bacterium]MAY03639.1 hypothetical protein [Gammaproteobacteria bacterium]
MVTMVVPFNQGEKRLEHIIETDVLSFASDAEQAESEETLEWNEEDISLFLKLISNQQRSGQLPSGESVRVDLSDPDTIEIVQIVAAAGFGLVQSGEQVLAQNSGTEQVFANLDLGTEVSLKTLNGFKRGIIVDSQDDDVVCVVLDEIVIRVDGEFIEICPHDVLMVKRHQVLHPMYSSETPSGQDILH